VKVIEQSPTRLIIEDRPWLLGLSMLLLIVIMWGGSLFLYRIREGMGALILALVGTGVPLLIAVLMVQRVRLTFDRSAGTLSKTRQSVFGFSQTDYALIRLLRAEVSESSDSEGTTYRLVLKLTQPDETVPFTSYFTSGRRPERLCKVVNEWTGARLDRL
jgi:hypothetical protein